MLHGKRKLFLKNGRVVLLEENMSNTHIIFQELASANFPSPINLL